MLAQYYAENAIIAPLTANTPYLARECAVTHVATTNGFALVSSGVTVIAGSSTGYLFEATGYDRAGAESFVNAYWQIAPVTNGIGHTSSLGRLPLSAGSSYTFFPVFQTDFAAATADGTCQIQVTIVR